MPHAALWVVQHCKSSFLSLPNRSFQCRTRLCGWCSFEPSWRHRSVRCFNAARGFVGGAAIIPHCAFTKLAKFQCRTRLCGWCSRGAHAARGYSLSPLPPLRGPPPPLTHGRLFSYGISASLPDARNLDCHIAPSQREGLRYFSFPHRYGGSGERSEPIGAPMPHAALWVVQQEMV